MIDNEIELVLRGELPTKNDYHIVPSELAKLQKQLDELLNADLLGLQKLYMRPQFFFIKRRMEVYDCASTIMC